jgi:hypothetical protein
MGAAVVQRQRDAVLTPVLSKEVGVQRSFAQCLKGLAALIALSVPATTATSGNIAYETAVKNYVASTVQPWINEPTITSAVVAQNSAFAAVSQADIAGFAREWRSETSRGGGPLTEEIMSRRLSRFLRGKLSASQGIVSEIRVLDNHGISVGMSDLGGEYWQGDKGRFVRTYGADRRGWLVEPPERDESNTLMNVQASIALRDGSGNRIGALTVTLSLDAL